MCDKSMKVKDGRISLLEAALSKALKKEEVQTKVQITSKTPAHSQRISVESNKENIAGMGNCSQPQVKLEDFLRKKSPSNPVSSKVDSRLPLSEAIDHGSSTKVLRPSNIEFSNKLATSLSQRQASSGGYPTDENLSSKQKFKSASIFGENLTEMFRKKKNASSIMVMEKKIGNNLTKQLSIKTPRYDNPVAIFKSESPHHLVGGVKAGKSVEKRSEIENILIKLLEEHKESNPAEDNFLNKLHFIEKAIKR